MNSARILKLLFSLTISSTILKECSSFTQKVCFLSFFHNAGQRQDSHRRESSISPSEWEDDMLQLKALKDREIEDALMDALFFNDSSSSQGTSSLLPISLKGQARIPVLGEQRQYSNQERIALVLTREESNINDSAATSSLLVPLSSSGQLKLVSFAAAGRPLSKSVLLGLNTLLINRDGALFDNLPWNTWSVDPQRRNYDASGNQIDAKYHLGKRDAFNRFMGKDWQGRSLAIGNMALRLKYMLEKEEGTSNETDGDEVPISLDESDSKRVLAIRMTELQVRELKMDLAEIESNLAVAKKNLEGPLVDLQRQESELLEIIATTSKDLATLTQNKSANPTGSSISEIMDRVADWTTGGGMNKAPYRGAIGYAPMLDSKQDIGDSLLPYTSPYDLLKEILEDQLNAKVLGCVLENSSLLQGNLALGGAVVLQRLTTTKEVNIAGESVKYKDYEEDFGNDGVQAGMTFVVECDSDEAIGVSLACNVPLKVESDILERAGVLVQNRRGNSRPSENIIEFLDIYKPIDPDMNFQVEGETQMSKSSNPISIPRTTASLVGNTLESKPSDSPMFPTDNPIKTLAAYDSLTNEKKAKLLLEMSNFSGRLPRPRAVRTSEDNPLDKLLIPLIDESVRRQFYIRDAEARGDFDEVNNLRAEKSRRQAAKEKAEQALESGREDAFQQWETEADFLESLRADVTQDEGAYSRFLDRDYWYETDRQAMSKRVDRSKFGNLLDGIE